MSGRHFSRSSEVAHLVAEVNRLSVEENLEVHGIDIDRIGVRPTEEHIFDTLYEEYFKTVHDWAAFTVDQESNEYDDFDDKYSKYDDEDA